MSIMDATARRKLPVRTTPHAISIGKALKLGLRRGPDTWCYKKRGGNWISLDVLADDGDARPANGVTILDFDQARDKAIEVIHGVRSKALTVDQALTRREQHLKAQADSDDAKARAKSNIKRVRYHFSRTTLGKALLQRELPSISESDWRDWADEIPGELATRKRTLVPLRAALNQASGDEDYARAWRRGTKPPRELRKPNNYYRTEAEIRELLAAADSAETALFFEAHAVIGDRTSQLARCRVRDLHIDDDLIDVPVSNKGQSEKVRTHDTLAIPAGLAARLRQSCVGREPDAPLFLRNMSRARRKDDGGWNCRSNDLRRPFQRAAKKAGWTLRKREGIYVLRHSSIKSAIWAGKNPLLIAREHNTSVKEIERTYASELASYTAKHDRELALRGRFDLDQGTVKKLRA
jgi:hypothetical protein